MRDFIGIRDRGKEGLKGQNVQKIQSGTVPLPIFSLFADGRYFLVIPALSCSMYFKNVTPCPDTGRESRVS